MIGFSFLGSVPAANRKRLKTEAGGGLQEVGTFSPVMSRAPFHCLNTIEKLWYFFVVVFFLSNNALKFLETGALCCQLSPMHVPGFVSLFLPWANASFKRQKEASSSTIMSGMERVLSLLVPTSVMTSVSVIQSNPQSCLLGAPWVMALV